MLNYKTSKVRKGRITKGQKFQNLGKRLKIRKSRKRRKNTVQYGKNSQKNFSMENQKGGEKYPWAFFFLLTVVSSLT
jgi:hypothetical protein